MINKYQNEYEGKDSLKNNINITNSISISYRTSIVRPLPPN